MKYLINNWQTRLFFATLKVNQPFHISLVPMWDEICEDALSRIDLNHGENWTEARVSTPLHNHTQGKKVRMSKEGFHQILDNLIDDKWIRAKHRGQTSAIIEFHQSSDKSQKISWLKARGLRVEQNPFRHH